MEPLTLCFGSSYLPIEQIIADAEERSMKSGKLAVTRIMAGAEPESIQREKRALTTIDMEPEKLRAIREDVEAFFDKDAQVLYRDTDTPYRRGYLIYGPPGTGKSSLSLAIPSHVNVTLVTITLHGMDDKMLEDAFSKLPYRCVVLIEDIDCVGAEVGNRDHQPGQTSQSGDEDDARIGMDVAVNTIEKAMEKLLLQQSQHNEGVLQRFINAFHRQEPVCYHRRHDIRPQAPELPKKVTLNGLLNVIDGATATEGRLLIMTTKHPEKLDKALLRKGRVDRHFEVEYATKITAELTFNRIFGQDTRKRHTTSAINQFAKAFSAQFPTHSEITTATLVHYCMQYQRQPCEAVRDFARYLELGDDMWLYGFSKPQNEPRDCVNVPESSNKAMLEMGPEDSCREDAILRDLAPRDAQPVWSLWRPWTWTGGRVEAESQGQLLVHKQNREAGRVGGSGVSFNDRGSKDIAVIDVPGTSEGRQAYIYKHLSVRRGNGSTYIGE